MSLPLPPDLDEAPGPKPPMTGRLILGSGSPRRRELLSQIGLEPDIIDAPNINETPAKGEKPRPYALRMAREKAEALEPHYLGNFIITGDTVVATGARILPQAQSLAQARMCLQMLSGRSHAVYSALTLITDAGRVLHRLTKSRLFVWTRRSKRTK